MIELFAKLLIAHFVGDFIILRNHELKEKGKKLWKSRWLLLHSLTHFGLALIVVGKIEWWPIAAVVGVSHYIGDFLVGLFSHRRPILWFITDQALHITILWVASALAFDTMLPASVIQVSWITIAGLVFITFPVSRLINLFLSQWPPAKSVEKARGMSNAGLWIGMLERILIYIFVVTGHWEGIGFLLAAKSIFRFGDLTNSKDIYLTEYIMVGTLISFSSAIITALLVLQFNL